ncbi:MAG: hypothetical protein HY858_12245 [Candidatus Solibacter usitatus]|nr:hypothetical protein [Candidatus Solibacter usitatus]
MKPFLTLTMVLLAAPLAAQKDFLTADEVDQIREVQEPNLRIQLYLKFARQRIDQLDQLFAKPRTGRSGMIHDLLEQYTGIIEAIDTYVDNSIKRQRPLTSLAGVAKTQREMLAELERFAGLPAPDKGRFQFVLEQALETTRDSAELSEHDFRERTRAIESREVDIRKEREEMLAPERKEELKKEQQKIEAEKQGVAPGKKKPSLYKPGEKPGEKPEEKKTPGKKD